MEPKLMKVSVVKLGARGQGRLLLTAEHLIFRPTRFLRGDPGDVTVIRLGDIYVATVSRSTPTTLTLTTSDFKEVKFKTPPTSISGARLVAFGKALRELIAGEPFGRPATSPEDEIARLSVLHHNGALTDEEFAEAKQRVQS